MYATLDGWPVTIATVQMPRYGVWYADIEALTSVNDDITGTVEFVLNDVALRCTVVRGGLVLGTWRGRAVGGNGKLGTALTPNFYRNVEALRPFKDALQEAGEELSATADISKLGTTLAYWSRVSKTAGQEIQALVRKAETSWRVLGDGTVWVGSDSRATFTGEYLELDICPELSKLEIIPTSVAIYPGMTLQNRLIDRLVHRLNENEFVTEVYFES